MKTKSTSIIKQNKDIVSVFVGSGAILMIPLVMMQFSQEWDWKLSDFIIIGTLLVGMGLMYVYAVRKLNKYKLILGILFLLATLLIWAELAVGIFGTPFAGS